MNQELTYTLRMALENNLPELNDVQIMYEGVSLTAIPKPFATVEYYQDVVEEEAAGHASYTDTYYFQVGVFANNVNELHRMQTKVRKVLRERLGHPLYQINAETGAFEQSGVLVPFIDRGFTPMLNGDNSNLTNNHRGYFDVAIEIY